MAASSCPCAPSSLAACTCRYGLSRRVLSDKEATGCIGEGGGRTCCEPELLPRSQVVEPDSRPESANLGSASAQAMRRGAHLSWVQLPCNGTQA